MKKLAALKQAVDDNAVGLSVLGATLGSIPGLLTWNKDDKTKSIIRTLLGASVGAGAGYMTRDYFSSRPKDTPAIEKDLPPKGHAIRADYAGPLGAIGAGLGILPGIVDLSRLKQEDEDYTRKRDFALAKLFGGGIGGFSLGKLVEKY